MPKTLRFVRPTSFNGMFHEVGEPVEGNDYSDADVDNLRASGQIDDVDDKATPAPAPAPAEQPKKNKK